MSAPGLTQSAQLRYLIQWFGEFSELQREDFLPVLMAARSGNQDVLTKALEALTCDDKPVSLFQCRIKLFNEWFTSWPKADQERFVASLSDLDKEFGRKLTEAEPTSNGEANGSECVVSDEDCVKDDSTDEEQPANSDVTENESNLQENNIPLEITAAS